jgi:hypothetical protein
MAQQSSFDIVSQIDLQEVDNAVNQAKKELATRFDFKGSKSTVEFLKDEKKIQLLGDDDMKLRNLQDILRTRFASRKISQKSLEFKTPEKAFDGCLRQEVMLTQGISQEKAKEIVKIIKDLPVKVQAAIQGDEIRVTSKSRDDLQTVMQHLRTVPLTLPIQFTNFR